jgi:vacuolar-type H+-ATPase subunit I/STV1
MLFLLFILVVVVFARSFHEGFYCAYPQSAVDAALNELNATKARHAEAKKLQAELTKNVKLKADEIQAWNNKLNQAMEIATENLANAYEAKQNIESDYQTTQQQLNTCTDENQLKLNAINIFS